MSDISPRKEYVRTFRRSLRYWKSTNLPDEACIKAAIKTAKEKWPLSEEHQREVDAFLADEMNPRKGGWQSTGSNQSIWVDYDVE